MIPISDEDADMIAAKIVERLRGKPQAAPSREHLVTVICVTALLVFSTLFAWFFVWQYPPNGLWGLLETVVFGPDN